MATSHLKNYGFRNRQGARKGRGTRSPVPTPPPCGPLALDSCTQKNDSEPSNYQIVDASATTAHGSGLLQTRIHIPIVKHAITRQ